MIERATTTVWRLGSASIHCAALYLSVAATAAWADEKSIGEKWEYAPAMKKVADKFRGREGVVLHVGDSITYANPYGAWARHGEGQTEDDKAALKWMHTGSDDDTDGWWLCRFDHPAGGRSYTACGGIRASEMLAGGKQEMPPFEKLLDEYRPQIVVVMLGTNDASAGRSADEYAQDMQRIVGLMVDRGIIPVVSTIPPHVGKLELSASYNAALRELAHKHRLPLIDYEREILERRPRDWDGTLLGDGDVHPTAAREGVSPTSTPTAENLRNSGYLLRGWLSVKKIAEVKRTVLDARPRQSSSLRHDRLKPNGQFEVRVDQRAVEEAP